jgi:hypothetical protein
MTVGGCVYVSASDSATLLRHTGNVEDIASQHPSALCTVKWLHSQMFPTSRLPLAKLSKASLACLSHIYDCRHLPCADEGHRRCL